MGLVDYSESESSDNELETKANAELSTQKSKQTSKPTFQKVVDKSNPRKIKVSLPEPVKPENTDAGALDDVGEGPPAKRARTAGAFGSFNSFLPAPKNAGKPTSSSDGSGGRLSSKGGGLGRGISLKTGSQPAFSRERVTPEEDVDERNGQYEEPIADEHIENRQQAEPEKEKLPDVVQEPQPAVKKAMFRPLSAARKPEKKKKKPPLVADGAGDGISRASTTHPASKEIVPPPKRSLFASTDTEMETPSATTDATQYQPYFEDDKAQDTRADPTDDALSSAARTTTQQPSRNLDTLASSLNLTPSQRRQLFGRSGAPSDAQLTSFSVSQEYTHNQEMAASAEAQAAAQVRTVKSIAPGKHSLQQLMNQASTQKDALEDSYAAGRQNKKAVGNRYGW